MDDKFQDATALEAWLKGNDVDPDYAADVCQTLFDKGYNLPSMGSHFCFSYK
jgi:hypothetical protein